MSIFGDLFRRITNAAPKGADLPAVVTKKNPGSSQSGWAVGTTLFSVSDFPRYNPDDLMQKKGYKIYGKMMLDDQVKAVYQFKRDAVTSRKWKFRKKKQKDGDGFDPQHEKIEEFFLEVISKMDMDFKDVLDNVLTAMRSGFSVNEKVYKQIQYDSKTYWGISQVVLLPFETFDGGIVAELGTSNVIEFRQMVSGRPVAKIPPKKVIHFVHQPDEDPLYGLSDLRAAYRAWWSKDVAIKFWNVHLERHAGGFVVATVSDPSVLADTKVKADLKATLENISALTAIMSPKGVDISLTTPATTQAYERAIAAYDQAIAKSMLVPALLGVSEQGDVGSYSQSQTHLEVFFWVLDKISSRLEGTLNRQLFRDLAEQNFGEGVDFPPFEFDPITETIKQDIIKTWGSLVSQAAVTHTQVDEEHIRELLQFPKLPENIELPQTPEQEQAAEAGKLALDQQKKAAKENPGGGNGNGNGGGGNGGKDGSDGKATGEGGGKGDKVVVEVSAKKKEHEELLSALTGERSPDIHVHMHDHRQLYASPDGSIVQGIETPVLKTADVSDQPAWEKRVNFTALKGQMQLFEGSLGQDIADIMVGVKKSLADQIERLAAGRSFGNVKPEELRTIAIPQGIISNLRRTIRARLLETLDYGYTSAYAELPKKASMARAGKVIKPGTDKTNYERFLSSRAMTIAGVLDQAVLNQVQNVLENGIRYDKNLGDVMGALETETDLILPEYDSAGRAVNVPARLENIARTNVADAINQGRKALFNEPALDGFIRGYEYSAIMDDRTTEVCELMNGIKRRDFGDLEPPNHFQCRSIIIPITELDDWDGIEDEIPDNAEPQKGFYGERDKKKRYDAESWAAWDAEHRGSGMPPKGIESTMESLINKTGGFTCKPISARFRHIGSNGYVVSPYKEHEKVFTGAKLSYNQVVAYMAENKYLLAKPGHYLGGWKDEKGNIVLDVSVIKISLNEAKKIGVENNQKAIFSLKTGKEIRLNANPQPIMEYADNSGIVYSFISADATEEEINAFIEALGGQPKQLESQDQDSHIYYDEDQPRDDSGRWTDTGAGGGSTGEEDNPESNRGVGGKDFLREVSKNADIFARKKEWDKLSRSNQDKLANAKRSIGEKINKITGGRESWPDTGNAEEDIALRCESFRGSMISDEAAKLSRDFGTRLANDIEELEAPPALARELAMAATDAIIAQEFEAAGRVLSDHGAHHITENVRIANDILTKGGLDTAENRVAVAFAAAYHDTGYLTPPADIFLDAGHERWGSQYFSAAIAPTLLEAFGKESAASISEIIENHNSNVLDWEGSPARSAFSLADNMALFHFEKMPPMLRDIKPMIGLLARYVSKDLTLPELRTTMEDMIMSKSGIPKDIKDQYMKAVKEVGPTLPGFTLGMVGARIAGVKWKGDHPEITIYRHKQSKAMSKLDEVLDLGKSQFKKFAKTFKFDAATFIEKKYLNIEQRGKQVLEAKIIERFEDFMAYLNIYDYDPDQPRDDLGRWTDSGGGGHLGGDQAANPSSTVGGLKEKPLGGGRSKSELYPQGVNPLGYTNGLYGGLTKEEYRVAHHSVKGTLDELYKNAWVKMSKEERITSVADIIKDQGIEYLVAVKEDGTVSCIFTSGEETSVDMHSRVPEGDIIDAMRDADVIHNHPAPMGYNKTTTGHMTTNNLELSVSSSDVVFAFKKGAKSMQACDSQNIYKITYPKKRPKRDEARELYWDIQGKVGDYVDKMKELRVQGNIDRMHYLNKEYNEWIKRTIEAIPGWKYSVTRIKPTSKLHTECIISYEFHPDQARDERGRWTDEGGSSAGIGDNPEANRKRSWSVMTRADWSRLPVTVVLNPKSLNDIPLNENDTSDTYKAFYDLRNGNILIWHGMNDHHDPVWEGLRNQAGIDATSKDLMKLAITRDYIGKWKVYVEMARVGVHDFFTEAQWKAAYDKIEESEKINSLFGNPAMERFTRLDYDYDESEHPRDERGRWTDSGAGGEGENVEANKREPTILPKITKNEWYAAQKRMLDHEEGAIVDDEGKVLARVKGTHEAIRFNDEQRAMLKDHHLIHNHPNYDEETGTWQDRTYGGTLSPNDVGMAIKHGAASIHAVDQGYHYEFIIPKEARGNEVIASLWFANFSLHGQLAIEKARTARGVGNKSEHDIIDNIMENLHKALKGLTESNPWNMPFKYTRRKLPLLLSYEYDEAQHPRDEKGRWTEAGTEGLLPDEELDKLLPPKDVSTGAGTFKPELHAAVNKAIQELKAYHPDDVERGIIISANGFVLQKKAGTRYDIAWNPDESGAAINGVRLHTHPSHDIFKDVDATGGALSGGDFYSAGRSRLALSIVVDRDKSYILDLRGIPANHRENIGYDAMHKLNQAFGDYLKIYRMQYKQGDISKKEFAERLFKKYEGKAKRVADYYGYKFHIVPHGEDVSKYVYEFHPDQPRDERGRWTDTGGAGSGHADEAASAARNKAHAIVYYGTTKQAFDKIKQEGIEPYPIYKGMNATEPMHGFEESVWLYDNADKAMEFARHAKKYVAQLMGMKVDPIIIRCVLPKSKLLKDPLLPEKYRHIGKIEPQYIYGMKHVNEETMEVFAPIFVAAGKQFEYDPALHPRDERGRWAETGSENAGRNENGKQQKLLKVAIRGNGRILAMTYVAVNPPEIKEKDIITWDAGIDDLNVATRLLKDVDDNLYAWDAWGGTHWQVREALEAKGIKGPFIEAYSTKELDFNTSDTAKFEFDPNQPRDEHGMWTDSGGTAVADEDDDNPEANVTPNQIKAGAAIVVRNPRSLDDVPSSGQEIDQWYKGYLNKKTGKFYLWNVGREGGDDFGRSHEDVWDRIGDKIRAKPDDMIKLSFHKDWQQHDKWMVYVEQYKLRDSKFSNWDDTDEWHTIYETAATSKAINKVFPKIRFERFTEKEEPRNYNKGEEENGGSE